MQNAAEQQAADLFIDAIDRDPADRSSFLDRACADNPALRSRVEHLLAVDARETIFLEPPIDAAGRIGEMCASVGTGTVVGQFEILRSIGSGSMGVVYEARQKRPARIVALKLMNLAVVESSARRRFEHEAEIMARLQHPGIAQVYDAGLYEQRMPWFAMEHIASALSLREYAMQRRLDRRSILKLFAKVCDAVQYAHQHGVIHRDLKPANILVDSGGQPKIIDFGVARLCEADVGAATMHTRAGQMIGTPRYMSPEQCAGPSASLIDLRSDVYTLGVILYELLTGVLPYPVEQGSLMQVAQMICQREPLPPSTVTRTLVGDLEIILLKSLEKELSRRYQSSAELADDVRRFLAGDPILARQASAMYVVRKRLQRYRVAALFSLALLLGVIAFAVYATLQARSQHELAVNEFNANRTAQEATGAANAAREHANAVTTYLVDTLGLADPDITQTGDITMDTVLERGSDRVGATFAQQPDVEATVRLMLGRGLAMTDRVGLANMNLRRALAIRRHDPATTPQQLYDVLWPWLQVQTDQTEVFRAETQQEIRDVGCCIIVAAHPAFDPALTRLSRFNLVEAKDPDLAQAQNDALEVLALASTSFTPDDPLWIVLADEIRLFGDALGWAGRLLEACEQLSNAQTIYSAHLSPTNNRTARTMYRLIDYTVKDGRPAEAETLARQAIDTMSRILPPTHWYVAALQARLAEALRKLGQLTEAELLLEDAMDRLSIACGESSSYCRDAILQYVYLSEKMQKHDRAAMLKQRLALAWAKSGDGANRLILQDGICSDQPELLSSLWGLVRLRVKESARVPDAMREFFRQWDRVASLDNPVSLCLADVLGTWANQYRASGDRWDDVRPAFERIRAVDLARGDRDPRKQIFTHFNLALIANRDGKYDEAESLLRAGIALLSDPLRNNERHLSWLQSLLGEVLTHQGRFADAEQHLLAANDVLRLLNQSDNADLRLTEKRLVDLYRQWNRPAAAEPLVRPGE